MQRHASRPPKTAASHASPRRSQRARRTLVVGGLFAYCRKASGERAFEKLIVTDPGRGLTGSPEHTGGLFLCPATSLPNFIVSAGAALHVRHKKSESHPLPPPSPPILFSTAASVLIDSDAAEPSLPSHCEAFP